MNFHPRSPAVVALAAALVWGAGAFGAGVDPSRPDFGGRKGSTLFVSRLGDGTDGTTWAKAFRTIQAALLAVPDDRGGHAIVIRPDTYAEANLYPAHKGAALSYNLLVGDRDGSLGSGATGWVVIDSGAPAVVVRTDPQAPTGNPTFKIIEGDPEKETGLKSVDWWGPWRCDPDFSGVIWDRWIYRNLYATGSEGGIGWDMTCGKGSEFSAVVEDCVGIGRFAGACVMAHVPRKGEPVLFRRSWFLNLDWWGDAGGVYVRGESPAPSEDPHAVFEDCTIAGPDNALQAGYPGVDALYTRVAFRRCRLIVFNFSQPQGTPSTGIICCGCKDGKQLHVDLEDCTLLGYKVFGTRQGDVSFSLKGRVAAYVQYRQDVPVGFERLRFWPVDAFQAILPPDPAAKPMLPAAGAAPEAPAAPSAKARPRLTKLPFAIPKAMENTPVVFAGRTLLVTNRRDDTKNHIGGYKASMVLLILDLATGEEIARFGEGHSFASAVVDGPELSVFASEGTDNDWFQGLHRFRSTDLKAWTREPAIPQEEGEHLFNTSVTRDPEGWLMAYESSKPVMFCFRFARSKDLSAWEKVPGLAFTGVGEEYSACPVIRYVAPCYYVIYLHAAVPGHTGWVSYLARSKDLASWELSPECPILEAGPGEGVNNSDVDILELDGSTYLYYATGDQATWGSLRVAQYPGPLREFFEGLFPAGKPTIGFSAKR